MEHSDFKTTISAIIQQSISFHQQIPSNLKMNQIPQFRAFRQISSSNNASTSSSSSLVPVCLLRNEQQDSRAAASIGPTEQEPEVIPNVDPAVKANVIAAAEIATDLCNDPIIALRTFSVVRSFFRRHPETANQAAASENDGNGNLNLDSVSLLDSEVNSLNSMVSSLNSSVAEFSDLDLQERMFSAPSSPLHRSFENIMAIQTSGRSSPMSGFESVDSQKYEPASEQPAPDLRQQEVNSNYFEQQVFGQQRENSPQFYSPHHAATTVGMLHQFRRPLEFSRDMSGIAMFAPLNRHSLVNLRLFQQNIILPRQQQQHNHNRINENIAIQEIQPDPASFEGSFAEPSSIRQLVDKLRTAIGTLFDQLYRQFSLGFAVHHQHEDEQIQVVQQEQAHALPLSDDSRRRKRLRRQKHLERELAETAFRDKARNAILAGLIVLSGAMCYRLLNATDAQIARSFKREFWISFINQAPLIFQSVQS